jgi:hypothetical protein
MEVQPNMSEHDQQTHDQTAHDFSEFEHVDPTDDQGDQTSMRLPPRSRRLLSLPSEPLCLKPP